ncbi:hypothetical protein BA768_09985 [Chryseobacterium sp. CBo1]|uniref:tetratricopeptide repeat protein n=1 Tax=Chryseobacterium sp. CBo1 TaxID=1869230 RepID=UPI000810B4DA|nr:tetratricopeptide repeat protein [Chryseobacterium sp. CBo1]OCK52958.1 hypothetical protein BA768_09985 [Chryseobacterium sp. CBo1]
MYTSKFIFVIVFFFFGFIKSNSYNTSVVDSLISVTDNLLYSNKINDVSKNGQLILHMSESMDYDRGKLYGNFYLAMASRINNDKENLVKYTFTSEILARKQKDNYVLAYSLLMKSTIYKEAQLYDKALRYINQGLKVCDEIKEKEKRHFVKGKIIVYKAICLYYFGVGSKKLLEVNLLAMQELQNAGRSFGYDYNYLNIANTYENLNNLDLAEYYYHKSIKVENTSLRSLGYYNLAAIAYKRGKMDTAIDYNTQSVDLQKKEGIKRLSDICENYKLFCDIYGRLNDKAKVDENKKLFDYYQQKEREANHVFNKKLLIQLVDTAEKEQQDLEIGIKKGNNISIILTSVISFLLIGILYIYKRESKKNKQNQKIIERKREKLSELGNKVNDAFTEVLELAKKDDPAFIPRFKEVYPTFYDNLLSKCPALSLGQIRFCCLLRLNFSTKEVAHYHHLTIKGVQTRKTRLRKQLNIPSDVDLNKWMMEELD